MIIEVEDEKKIKDLGRAIGASLIGGEVIELVGDVGAGKTTLTKGIAAGLGVGENVQSPSFTINRVYRGRDGITLSHYDFYRLADAGIMASELSESLQDDKTVTVIEWSEAVKGVLPADRLSILINTTADTSRKLIFQTSGPISENIIKGLSDDFID